ncbi:MAG: ribosome biogenesis GTPase Der [Gammaproteobacteria bacterium]|nr:ribosome biogenesis GTPase Der [Gammaproteobacteria bacterium]
MIPTIAIVGRPNVGKSTLFNVLTKTRSALVANFPGLTRDRHYGEVVVDDRRLVLIDTGGLGVEDEYVDSLMAAQVVAAIKEADLLLFVVDARDGVTPLDESLAQDLRKYNKPIYLVINKVDGVNQDLVHADFVSLGLQGNYLVAASHNRGVRQLLQEIFVMFPEAQLEEVSQGEDAVKIAFLGRPNAGKSTLVNRILGEDRVVVNDKAGTTRDAISVPFKRAGKDYVLIDTAGIRRRGKVKETVEKFSVIKALQAIAEANVVVLLIDAKRNIAEQDLRILSFVLQAGRSLVIAVNKWDDMSHEEQDEVKSELDRRLNFINFAEVHFISALHGKGVSGLFPAITRAYLSATQELNTSTLTKILEGAVTNHQPPLVHGRRVKLRMAHPGGSNPPIIVIHGNQVEKLPDSYKRYLENYFRKALKIVGTPISLEFKQGENPYAGRRNKLTPRQQHKKRRLIRFVKRSK